MVPVGFEQLHRTCNHYLIGHRAHLQGEIDALPGIHYQDDILHHAFCEALLFSADFVSADPQIPKLVVACLVAFASGCDTGLGIPELDGDPRNHSSRGIVYSPEDGGGIELRAQESGRDQEGEKGNAAEWLAHRTSFRQLV